MPIILYKCEACGKEFPKIVLKPEAVPRACPVCGASDVYESGLAFDAAQPRSGCAGCDACDAAPKQVYSFRFPSA
jgi:putative FmdB family regulatory protein